MENAQTVAYIMERLKGKPLQAVLIPCSKNHNHKPMIVVSEAAPDGVTIWHLEVSEEGVFAYEFDDGVS